MNPINCLQQNKNYMVLKVNKGHLWPLFQSCMPRNGVCLTLFDKSGTFMHTIVERNLNGPCRLVLSNGKLVA